MARRLASFAVVLLLFGAFVAPVASAQTDVKYSIKEARAYAYKASLDKLVVEAAPKCDPQEDQYECDEGRWNHKPNCPSKIEIGPGGKAPRPKPPPVDATRGGAGEKTGGDQPPPQSSPIRYNRFVTLGSLSRITGLREARGFASETYVDLSGRDDGNIHTESEAYGTARAYEERCWPEDAAKDGDNYTHLLSRSDKTLSTYHFSQCLHRQCFFGAPGPGSFGAEAEKAQSIVHLSEANGSVVGRMSSVVEDLKYGGGQFTVDSIKTFVEFTSDGTPQGLKWSVSSTANGARLGGQPITLPPGRMVSGPGFSVGMAAPYVEAEQDGTKLTIVAAGLTIGTEQQAAFFGGAEVFAGIGGGLGGFSLPPPSDDFDDDFGGGGDGFDSPVGGIGSVGGAGFDTGAFGTPGVEPPQAAGIPEEILVYEQPTGVGAVPLVIALGLITWFLLMSRWLQRFGWGRKLMRVQPFRTIDWVYRAFVKT